MTFQAAAIAREVDVMKTNEQILTTFWESYFRVGAFVTAICWLKVSSDQFGIKMQAEIFHQELYLN